eukprot:Transcript_25566.p1 GENE.Transcript_25566~~Transcript_25566.p1  ORF type:complete len:406 (+),score=199.73 Transcript_25566:65-1282(+)
MPEHALSTYFPPGALPAPCAQDLRRGQKLRLFVYPLPWDYHGKIVQYVEGKARSLLSVKCDYLREDSCPNTGFSHLENLRSHCTDVPLMAKLLQSAQVVTDAKQAQVFLVPFLMGCNAMLGWGHGMQRVNAAAHHRFFGNFRTFARESLPHFARWPHRHLFLFPLDSMFSPKWLRQSMIAHTGAGYIGQSNIDVPVPYLVSLPPQPAEAADANRPRERLVFLMASPSRNKVRVEVARQLREARTAHGSQVELYETDPRLENAMPLSAAETMKRMRATTFCVAPTGDSDGFTQRFYYIVAAGCIPVRVDTYYSDKSFGKVAWPFKQSIEWRRAVVLLPPRQLRRVGLMPTLLNISAKRVAAMQQYIATVVRPAVLFDYRGRAPDAYSAFLAELLHLTKTRLPRLDP